MPVKARSLRILRIYVNITASILPDSYIDQHPSETTTQIIGRHKQHLDLPMLHADKSDDAASMTGNNKSGDCTERLTYKRRQTLNIRFGKEMVVTRTDSFHNCRSSVIHSSVRLTSRKTVGRAILLRK